VCRHWLQAKTKKKTATVVQVLQDLSYVLLHVYFTCDRSLRPATLKMQPEEGKEPVEGTAGPATSGARSGAFGRLVRTVVSRSWLYSIHRVREKRVWSISGITSSNTDRFLKFFDYYNLQKICNKAIVKYPTTPQTRHYTTL